MRKLNLNLTRRASFALSSLIFFGMFASLILFAMLPNVVTIKKSDLPEAPTVSSGTPPLAPIVSPTSTPQIATSAEPIAPDPVITPVSWMPPAGYDTAAYDAKMLVLADLPVITKKRIVTSTLPSGAVTSTIIIVTSTAKSSWPVKATYPLPGALLPFNRIVAYYGNLYSKQMGVLGKYPEDQMLAMLASTTRDWAAADPATPTIPALDYIVVAAQATGEPDGMYRLRMPSYQVKKIIAMAAKVNGIVFLDVQVGLSTLQKEIPILAPYLKLPQVHLAIDPEFAMHNSERPGTVIGTMDAADINYAASYLSNIVKENNLPPKILVIHRFTQAMVTNYRKIIPTPEVQIVMDMDGFGGPAKKIGTYQNIVASEPVQFTGFKLFYLNDAVTYGNHLMTPAEVLRLSPNPSYIQYQ